MERTGRDSTQGPSDHEASVLEEEGLQTTQHLPGDPGDKDEAWDSTVPTGCHGQKKAAEGQPLWSTGCLGGC